MQLRGIARYMLEQTGDDRAGERFVRDLEARILKLAALPGTLGRPRPELGEAIRSLPHHGYIIIFRYEEVIVDVVQILHSRQDLPSAFSES